MSWSMPRWIVSAWIAILLCGCGGGGTTIREAVADSIVTASLGAFDEASDSVTVTIARVASASGEISVEVPAGTIINNGDEGGQRLMTAATVIVVLPADATTASATVEVYCLDQFQLRPTSTSTLFLPAEESGGDTGTEAVRELADCLEGKGLSSSTRQMAIWMVTEGYIEQDADTVRQRLMSAFSDRMRAQIPGEFETYARKIRGELSNLTPERVEAALQRYRNRLPAKIDEAAYEETDKAMSGFRDSREALTLCIDDVDAKPFFAGAQGS